jgi:hypothetical protein
MNTTTVKPIEWTRANNSNGGIPRYVCHFFAFLTQSEIDSYGTDNFGRLYDLGVRRSKRLGGRKFDNKQYGGGIVFRLGARTTEQMTGIIREMQELLEINEDTAKAAAHC